jgi:hypothetical protein
MFLGDDWPKERRFHPRLNSFSPLYCRIHMETAFIGLCLKYTYSVKQYR